MGKWVVCATTAVLLAFVAAAVCAPRRPIPRAADAVDQAAGAFEELCDEARDVVQDCRRQGMVTGAFGVYVIGVPLLTVEWQVNLPPKQKG